MKRPSYPSKVSIENKSSFYLKMPQGMVVIPVDEIYFMQTLKRDYTLFHLFDSKNKYRLERQNGRMQNHIVGIQNDNLFITKRGYCVNLKNVKGINSDNTVLFKNNEILNRLNFPGVAIAKDKLRYFQDALLKIN